MQTTIENGKFTIAVSGRVDTTAAPELEKYINEFVGDPSQFDDLTMLCLELKEDDSNKKQH